MKRQSAVTVGLVACVGASVAAVAWADVPVFTDPTKCSVLRRFDAKTGQQLVTATRTSAGDSYIRTGGADGGGNEDHTAGSFDSNAWVSTSYDLGRTCVVGSYMFQIRESSRRPARFLIEGYDSGSNWVTLANVTNITVDYNTGSFVQTAAVTKVRYTAYGPASSSPPYYFIMNEWQVYMAAGQNVSLYDGFNYLRDLAGTQTASTQVGTGSNVTWVAPYNNFNALRDRDFQNHVKAQYQDSGVYYGRAFVTYSLAQGVQMYCATLGGYGGQGWGKWEVYTSDATTMPPLQALATTDPATIQAAGWTLQYQQAVVTELLNFSFRSPGRYRHIAIVWDAQWGAEVQFELFAAPPPAGSLVLLR